MNALYTADTRINSSEQMDTAQQSMRGMSACALDVKSTLLFCFSIGCPAVAKVKRVALPFNNLHDSYIFWQS